MFVLVKFSSGVFASDKFRKFIGIFFPQEGVSTYLRSIRLLFSRSTVKRVVTDGCLSSWPEIIIGNNHILWKAIDDDNSMMITLKIDDDNFEYRWWWLWISMMITLEMVKTISKVIIIDIRFSSCSPFYITVQFCKFRYNNVTISV